MGPGDLTDGRTNGRSPVPFKVRGGQRLLSGSPPVSDGQEAQGGRRYPHLQWLKACRGAPPWSFQVQDQKSRGPASPRTPSPRAPGCHLIHAGLRCLGAPVSASGVQPTSGGAHQHGAEPGAEHQTMSPNPRHVPTARGVALVVLSMCPPQEKSQGTPASCPQGRPNHPCVEDTPETRADQGAQALCLI